MEVLMETGIGPEPEDLQEQQGDQEARQQLELELDQVGLRQPHSIISHDT